MKKAIALFAVAGVASIASAAGTLVVNIVPQAGSIGAGGSVVLDVYADYSGVVDGLSLAGFKVDFVGNSNGTLTGQVNSANFSNGVTHGTQSGSNLLDFAGGQLPPGLGGTYTGNYLGSVTYTDSGTAGANYSVSITITDFVAPTGALNVYTTSLGVQSRSSLSSDAGANHLVVINAGTFDVIIPTPASMALLGLGGLVAGRRRR